MSRLEPEQKQQIKSLIERKEGVLCRQGVATREMLQAMADAIRLYNEKIAGIRMDEDDDSVSTGSTTREPSTPQRDANDEVTQSLLQAALADPNSEAYKQLPDQLQNYVQELIKAKAKSQEKGQEESAASKVEAEISGSRPKAKMNPGYRPRPGQ